MKNIDKLAEGTKEEMRNAFYEWQDENCHGCDEDQMCHECMLDFLYTEIGEGERQPK